jgi:hypothetical protein
MRSGNAPIAGIPIGTENPAPRNRTSFGFVGILQSYPMAEMWGASFCPDRHLSRIDFGSTHASLSRMRALVDKNKDAVRSGIRKNGRDGEPASASHLLFQIRENMGIGFLAFLKPYNAILPLDHAENYYMEREWHRLGNVPFDSTVVGHVIVPPPFVKALRREFPEFADKIEDTDSHANLRDASNRARW